MKPGETLSQRYFTAISCEFIGEYDDSLFRLFHATSSSLLQTINDQWFLRAAWLEHWVSTSRHGSSPTNTDKQQFPLILTQHNKKRNRHTDLAVQFCLRVKQLATSQRSAFKACIHNLNWPVLCDTPKACKPCLSMMKLDHVQYPNENRPTS